MVQTNNILLKSVNPQVKLVADAVMKNVNDNVAGFRIRSYAALPLLCIVLLFIMLILSLLSKMFRQRQKSIEIFEEFTFQSLEERSIELNSKLNTLSSLTKS